MTPSRGTALVTGASSGIGRATAAALNRHGYRVIVHGRDAGALAETARAVDGRAVVADLVRPEEVERLADEVLEAAGGHLDVVVNNAGAGWSGAFPEMDPEATQRLLAVNLAAPIALTRLLLPAIPGGGNLVFVTSIAGRLGVAGEAVYSAAKAGLDCFAESLRGELRGTGVRVGVVVPGVVDTPFFVRRGTPYARQRPKPIPASAVADAVLRCVETGAAEVYAPRWLRVPVAVRAVAPGVYRRLDARFGADQG